MAHRPSSSLTLFFLSSQGALVTSKSSPSQNARTQPGRLKHWQYWSLSGSPRASSISSPMTVSTPDNDHPSVDDCPNQTRCCAPPNFAPLCSPVLNHITNVTLEKQQYKIPGRIPKAHSNCLKWMLRSLDRNTVVMSNRLIIA